MKKLALLFLLVVASFFYFNKKELVIQPAQQLTEKKELALPVKPIVENKEEIAAETKAIGPRPEIKDLPNLIKTPAGDAEISLEQFKKENPEAIVKIEKFNFNETNPGSMPTLEQFKKDNPNVTIKIETFEMSPAKK